MTKPLFWKVGEENLRFRLDMNAQILIEDLCDRSISDMLSPVTPTITRKELRAIVYVGLLDFDPEITVKKAGDLMQEGIYSGTSSVEDTMLFCSKALAVSNGVPLEEYEKVLKKMKKEQKTKEKKEKARIAEKEAEEAEMEKLKKSGPGKELKKSD